jgi:hypothetical protein
MRTLFIGGCMDGEWKVFSDRLRYRRVYKESTPTTTTIPFSIETKTEVYVYVEMKLRASDVEHSIYIPEEMPPYEALRLLIDNYRPNENKLEDS